VSLLLLLLRVHNFFSKPLKKICKRHYFLFVFSFLFLGNPFVGIIYDFVPNLINKQISDVFLMK
jgi:hypothetical protein